MPRISLKKKMTVVVSLMVALLLTGTGSLFLLYFEREFKESIARQQATLAWALANEIDGKIATSQLELESLAGSLAPLLKEPSRLRERLESGGGTRTTFDNGLFVFLPDGRMLISAPARPELAQQNFSFREYLKVPLSTGRSFVSEPFRSRQRHGHPIIMFSVPVLSSGKVVAVLCGSLDLLKDNFLGKIAILSNGSGGYLYLFNTDRTMIMHPDRERILKKDVPPGANRLYDVALAGKDVNGETVTSRGMHVLSSFRHLKRMPWVLATNYPLSEAYAPLRRAERGFLAVLLLAIVISGATISLIMRRLTAPLLLFTRKVAASEPEGEGHPEVPGTRSGDEIEALERAFDRMMETMTRRSRGEAEKLHLLQALSDAIPCPIYYQDREGNYLGCNRAFEACVGKNRCDLVGRPVLEISPRDREVDRELLEVGGARQYESRVVDAQGKPRDFIFYKALFSDADGAAEGIVATLLEITGRKRTEAALEEQKAFSENLLQNSAIPTFVLNARHEVVIWNRACAELTGIPAEEVLGTSRHRHAFYGTDRSTLADLVLEEECQGAEGEEGRWRRSPLLPEGVQGEAWLKNSRGLDGYHLFSAAPLKNRSGAIIAAIETVEEITERKKTEEELRKLSCAVEQSPGMVVITDTSGRIEYVNRKFVEVTGYQREEVVGGTPRLLKSGLVADEVYRDLWSTIKRGEEWRGELQNRKKNGELYWEHATISPVQDQAGGITHYIALMEDITEQRALGLALRHAQKMEALGTLTGGVAHDFNNILTAIIGYANLIQLRVPEGDPARRCAEQVLSAAERATSLTQSLITYSRSQSINPAPVELSSLVARVGKLLKRVVGEGVEICSSLSEAQLVILADSGQLEQLLMNLGTNAADAMGGGGSLAISTSAFTMDERFVKQRGFGAGGNYAVLTVSDSGAGLDEKTRERIFEPFFTTAQRAGGGPGLGLSIVYGIVKQHRGFIEVESTLGVGTTFTIYFPLLPLAMGEQREVFSTAATA